MNEHLNEFYVENKEDSSTFSQQKQSKDNVDNQIKIRSWDGESIDQVDFIQNILNFFTEKTPGKQNVYFECIYNVIRTYITRLNRCELIGFNIPTIRNIMKSLGYTISISEVRGIHSRDKYIGLSWKDTIKQYPCLNDHIHRFNEYMNKHYPLKA
jgi:hypothetical protein